MSELIVYNVSHHMKNDKVKSFVICLYSKGVTMKGIASQVQWKYRVPQFCVARLCDRIVLDHLKRKRVK
jgi:hypothetical protein